jgi:hypothetical protein
MAEAAHQPRVVDFARDFGFGLSGLGNFLVGHRRKGMLPASIVGGRDPHPPSATRGGANGSLFARTGFVLSHPFRRERGMDGALGCLWGEFALHEEQGKRIMQMKRQEIRF